MPVVLYTSYRLALFAAFFALLWWVGLQSWLAAVAAAVLAWLASYAMLRRPRDAAVAWLAHRADDREGRGVTSRLRKGLRDDEDVEDAVDERARRAAGNDVTPAG